VGLSAGRKGRWAAREKWAAKVLARAGKKNRNGLLAAGLRRRRWSASPPKKKQNQPFIFINFILNWEEVVDRFCKI
jgi:hypothetical protein